MGLAPFVAAYTWKAARDAATTRPRALRAFWTKIFAINFAAGVVTGIPMEFQFGTNWAAFSRVPGRSSVSRSRWRACSRSSSSRSFWARCSTARAAFRRSCIAWAAVARLRSARGSRAYFIVATRRVDAASGRLQRRGRRYDPTGEHLGVALFAVLNLAVRARALPARSLAGGFIVAGVGAYYLLSAAKSRSARRLVRAGTIVASHLFVARNFSDRRPKRARRDELPAGQARGDGGTLQDRARRTAGDHRHAGRA